MCDVTNLVLSVCQWVGEKIKEEGKGVKVGANRVRLLLYADDIVLLAESKQDLQKMLDVVTSYSKKWRFRVNPKKGKSEVMVFGRNPRGERRWMLAELRLEKQRCTSTSGWS